jgi:hypothetical protein
MARSSAYWSATLNSTGALRSELGRQLAGNLHQPLALPAQHRLEASVGWYQFTELANQVLARQPSSKSVLDLHQLRHRSNNTLMKSDDFVAIRYQ